MTYLSKKYCICGAPIKCNQTWCETCRLERRREQARKQYQRNVYKPRDHHHPCSICGADVTDPHILYCSVVCRRVAERRREAEKFCQPGGYAISCPGAAWGWNGWDEGPELGMMEERSKG
jgi:hypothetical protein